MGRGGRGWKPVFSQIFSDDVVETHPEWKEAWKGSRVRAYRRLDVEALAALHLPAEAEAEVEARLREYTRYILEREARSLAFVDEVRHRPG